jgi:hypothetical protein
LLFRSERIWAVLGVVLLIWIGIVVQQLILNRKISRLERELDEQESTPDRSNSATAGHSSGHNPA